MVAKYKIGDRIDNWTIISESINRPNERVKYLCECICEYEHEISIDALESQHSKSCPNCAALIAKARGDKIQGYYITAFNETKSFEDWTKDSRCTVDKTTLRRRLNCGIPFEYAIKL